MVNSANVRKGGEVPIVMVCNYRPALSYLHDLTRLSSLPVRQVCKGFLLRTQPTTAPFDEEGEDYLEGMTCCTGVKRCSKITSFAMLPVSPLPPSMSHLNRFL